MDFPADYDGASAGDEIEVEERQVYLKLKEISPNIVFLREKEKKLLGEGTLDGATYAFVSKMEEEGMLPEDTLEHIFAVSCLVNCEDSTRDIIEDSIVFVKKKKEKVLSKSQKNKRKRRNVQIRGGEELCRMTLDEEITCSSQLVLPGSGKMLANEYLEGISSYTETVKKARFYITVNEVMDEQSNGDSFYVVILWVVCHKNFDFVGKLARLCKDPDTWRGKEMTSSLAFKVEKRSSNQERLYVVWERIFRKQIQLLPISRGLELNSEVKSNPLAHVDIIDSPWSFISVFNPYSAMRRIFQLCPSEWRDPEIEGMGPIKNLEISPMMWIACNLGRQLQFERCRRDILQREKLARASKKQKKKDADDECEENASEDEGLMDIGYEFAAGNEPDLYNFHGMEEYGQEFLVRDSFSPGCAPFDTESGVARIPYSPGWITDIVNGEVVDDIPQCEMRHEVDFHCMERDFEKILSDINYRQFLLNFGGFPSATMEIIQGRRYKLHENLMKLMVESELLRPVTGDLRREIYDRAKFPLSGYIFDSSYARDTERFKNTILHEDRCMENILYLRQYLERKSNALKSDIKAKKMLAANFESTVRYVQCLGADFIACARGQLNIYAEGAFDQGSDFENAHRVLNALMSDINASHLKLDTANFDFLHSLFEGEIAWRMGTYGNWQWLGMTVMMCDGGGLTTCVMKNQNTPNMRKAGSGGFDFTVRSYSDFRKAMYFWIPVSVTDLFQRDLDGQMIQMQGKLTPGAVGDWFKVVDGVLVRYPSDSVGIPKVFSEGCGENADVADALVLALPRDDNITVFKETTVDKSTHGGGTRVLQREQQLTGSGCVMLAWGENRQSNLEYVRRKQDLLRVLTVRPTRTKCQRLCKDSTAKQKGFTHVQMPPPLAKRIATVTSCVQLISTMAAVHQKTGVIRFDIGEPVRFTLSYMQSFLEDELMFLVSPYVRKDLSRKWSVAQATAGVTRSLWVRGLEMLSEPSIESVEEMYMKILRLQSADALHVSLQAGTFMRFLTQILDFQSLAVLRVMFEEIKIPLLSVKSAVQFRSGVLISNRRERDIMRTFVLESMHKGGFGLANPFGIGTMSNLETNMSAYLTSAPLNHNMNGMRVFDDQIANPGRKRAADKWFDILCESFANLAFKQLTVYAGFDEHDLQGCLHFALKHLLQTEFRLVGFLAQGKPPSAQRVFQMLFGDRDNPRFVGMQATCETSPIIQEIRLPNSDYGIGVFLPDAVVLRSFMGEAGCDWEVQVEVAKQIACHIISTKIPYSLLPVDEFTMDNATFEANPRQMVCKVQRQQRPLSLERNASRFLVAQFGEQNDPFEGERLILLEDFAHMHSIVYMAREARCLNVRDMDLSMWDFEVWWGNPSDITPLWQYHTLRQAAGEFAALEGRQAYVQVDESNRLQLVVKYADGSIKKCNPGTGTRRSAQEFFFQEGWGPAVRWSRSSVVFRYDGALATVVPEQFAGGSGDVDVTATPIITWFNKATFTYTCQVSDGRSVAVSQDAIFSNLVPYRTKLLARENAICLLDGEVLVPTAALHGWVQCVLSPDISGRATSLGKVSVVLRHESEESRAYLLKPEDIKEPDDEVTFVSHFRAISVAR